MQIILHSDIHDQWENKCKYIHHMSNYSRHLNDTLSSNICPEHTQQNNERFTAMDHYVDELFRRAPEQLDLCKFSRGL